MKKRALILQGGTMRGAFLVGVMVSIYELLGLDYFDAIYSSSVGIFEQVFFAANQPDMQNTWREHVTGRQLINPLNILKGKQILDLDYLVGIFQSDKSRLNLQALTKFPHKLFTFVSDYETKNPVILDINPENVFDLMRAACAMPFMYNKKVIINNRRYLDSSTANIKKFQNLLESEMHQYDEVIVVINYPDDIRMKKFKNIIRPSKMPLIGSLDTNRSRIIRTIDQGKLDAAEYIKKHHLIKP